MQRKPAGLIHWMGIPGRQQQPEWKQADVGVVEGQHKPVEQSEWPLTGFPSYTYCIHDSLLFVVGRFYHIAVGAQCSNENSPVVYHIRNIPFTI